MRRAAKYIVAAGMGALAAATVAFARKLRALDVHVVRGSRFGFAFVATLPANPKDGLDEDLRVLYVGGTVQSATYLGERRMEAPFAYLKAFDLVFDAPDPVRNVAMLGGGGFAWPKHALTRHPELEMDVAEADPAIVDAARRWFFLDELEAKAGERLGVFVCEAPDFLERGALYDAIVNDIFRAEAPDANLMNPEGLGLVRRCLVPQGLYLVNVVCSETDPAPLQRDCELLRIFFDHVWVVPATDDALSDDDNYVVVATDGDFVPEGAFEGLPAVE